MRRGGAGEHPWAEVSHSEVNVTDRYPPQIGRPMTLIIPRKQTMVQTRQRWQAVKAIIA